MLSVKNKSSHVKKSWALWIVISLFALAALSCEDADDNKLATAQECLDRLPGTATGAEALVCENKIAGVESSQAYVIRCSVQFIVGGITTISMINAINDINNLPSNKQSAALMAALDQGDGAQAQNTYNACKKSGVASLEYIATLSLAGTLMIAGTAGDTDPAAFLPNCQTSGCDDAVIGSAVISLHGSYCTGDVADSTLCQDISAAITSGGGDPAAVANALYTLLQ